MGLLKLMNNVIILMKKDALIVLLMKIILVLFTFKDFLYVFYVVMKGLKDLSNVIMEIW